jgi:polar amino acid transport system ATP-binding protein
MTEQQIRGTHGATEQLLNPALTATASPAPVLSIRGLTKSYGERTILDGIDLDVAPGEKVALIGPSGSGKTTVLRLAMGLEKPGSGTIKICGNYLWHKEVGGQLQDACEKHARVVRRSVGMVFQQFNLFPHFTVLQNVVEPMIQVLRVSKEEAQTRARELLSQVGLSSHFNHLPIQLSGGQQQRVAIARSVALKPKVILFDEVTSALDPERVGEVLHVMRDLAEQGDMSMLLVTHEMSFAEDIANRVLMFDSGKIVEEGPPHHVMKTPSHPRTQQFLRAILER